MLLMRILGPPATAPAMECRRSRQENVVRQRNYVGARLQIDAADDADGADAKMRRLSARLSGGLLARNSLWDGTRGVPSRSVRKFCVHIVRRHNDATLFSFLPRKIRSKSGVNEKDNVMRSVAIIAVATVFSFRPSRLHTTTMTLKQESNSP
jgi:hypothetical protein